MFGSRMPMARANRDRRDVNKKFLSYRFKGELMKSKRLKEEAYDANAKWNGIVGDLVSGAAHMSFAALSVSSARSEVIDFSVSAVFHLPKATSWTIKLNAFAVYVATKPHFPIYLELINSSPLGHSRKYSGRVCILHLLSQKVGAPKSSAAEYYVQKANRLLWEHMSKYALKDTAEGVDMLR
ncbi:hypothetical protein HUJ05_008498 [Dendroctonus ponderosae]|nr:hypothetical protein HUJ05_008498 [Dendroctonus ponderosae]